MEDQSEHPPHSEKRSFLTSEMNSHGTVSMKLMTQTLGQTVTLYFFERFLGYSGEEIVVSSLCVYNNVCSFP